MKCVSFVTCICYLNIIFYKKFIGSANLAVAAVLLSVAGVLPLNYPSSCEFIKKS